MSEEEEILSQHLDDTKSLAQLLLSTASSLNDAQSVREQIKEIERMIEEYPEKS